MEKNKSPNAQCIHFSLLSKVGKEEKYLIEIGIQLFQVHILLVNSYGRRQQGREVVKEVMLAKAGYKCMKHIIFFKDKNNFCDFIFCWLSYPIF